MRSLFDLVPYQSPVVSSPDDLFPGFVYKAPGDVYLKFFGSGVPGYSCIIYDHPTLGVFHSYIASSSVRIFIFSLIQSDSVYSPHYTHVKLTSRSSLRSLDS